MSTLRSQTLQLTLRGKANLRDRSVSSALHSRREQSYVYHKQSPLVFSLPRETKKEKKENAKKPHKVRFSWFSFTKHLKRHPWIQLVKSNNIKQWTIHKIIRGPTKNNQTHRATRHESTGLAKAAAWHQVCSKVTITAVNYFNWQTTSKCGIIL